VQGGEKVKDRDVYEAHGKNQEVGSKGGVPRTARRLNRVQVVEIDMLRGS